ncbi:hypothetical protein BC936DRAFT_143274 [Jimgerdemannia flammicorona]|uniref:Uncharacterized protein n=1 Tax=Jimgerdemannia flammicorona TaxID=994334 RepID=A0A432ZZB6_9FUNG|nr:hypothetical protein BC936DRAFT_143274 [Jimgerdemannia flammicorona]
MYPSTRSMLHFHYCYQSVKPLDQIFPIHAPIPTMSLSYVASSQDLLQWPHMLEHPIQGLVSRSDCGASVPLDTVNAVQFH